MQIRWCFGWRSVAWSPQVWGPSPGRHWGGSSRWWCRQKKSSYVVPCWSGELSVACPSVMFSALKSLNFAGLICLLFAGRGFKMDTIWFARAHSPPVTSIPKVRSSNVTYGIKIMITVVLPARMVAIHSELLESCVFQKYKRSFKMVSEVGCQGSMEVLCCVFLKGDCLSELCVWLSECHSL